MKKLIALLLVLSSCTPVRYVNVERRHNYYERHRFNTYTVPVWVPGRGAILETRIVRPHRPMPQPKQEAPQRPSKKH
jgi:hypothetical protein